MYSVFTFATTKSFINCSNYSIISYPIIPSATSLKVQNGFIQSKLIIRKSSFEEPQNVTVSIMTWLAAYLTSFLFERTLSEQKVGRQQNNNGNMSVSSLQPKPCLPVGIKIFSL